MTSFDEVWPRLWLSLTVMPYDDDTSIHFMRHVACVRTSEVRLISLKANDNKE